MTPRSRGRDRAHPLVQQLEGRILPSPIGYTPAQIRHAYGYDRVVFEAGGQAVPGDGRGVTIALFEIGDTPGLEQALDVFDRAFDLPGLTPWTEGSSPPSTPYLRKIGFDGGDQLNAPPSDQDEAILDVEWAHAVAPAASFLVVEAALHSELPEADAFAARQPGVAVVSNSYSTYNYLESPRELRDDPLFTTPPGHPGVTFLDSSGDTGAPSHPPAFSSNVLSVGGTSLTLDASGGYGSETGWAGSGGGPSLYEPRAPYQRVALPHGPRRRAVPDVSIVANKNTGVAVYNPAKGGWTVGGGTSLAAPLWAAIIAIADQGRALRGLGSLDGPTQTLAALYRLPRRDFRDITRGNNGFPARRGYDLVTGRGSPYVDRVVSGLVASPRPGHAPLIGIALPPPASYYAPPPSPLRAIAGSAFNGIIAARRLHLSPQQAGAVTGTVNWGDGTPTDQPPIFLNPLGRGVFQVRTVLGSPGRKIYAAPGTYRIAASLTLPSGSTMRIQRIIRVAPAPLTAAGQAIAIQTGAPFSGPVATFTDPGRPINPVDSRAASSYRAEIRWGDGTMSRGTVSIRSTAPGFLVSGRHTYREPGREPISVRILEYGPGGRRQTADVVRAVAVVREAPGQ